jgi:hypothetical protein
MEDDPFDAFVRSIAMVASRRRLIRSVIAGLGAATLAAVGRGPAALAYRRCRLPDGRRGRLCSGQCVDVKNDPQNCGGCGRVCSDGTFCCNGWCADPAQNAPGCCPPSILCGDVCTSPYSDPNNCGACGIACGANQDCCDRQCLNRGTAQNCEACTTCGGGFTCDPNAYGPGVPGCVCPDENCALN